jgi:HD-GYP domain-containing protein (c-di-GMP phosphodiesterase class II)
MSTALQDHGVELAQRLRLACEAHDPSIGSHLDRVSRYAVTLGRLLGLSERQLLELHYATPLHDMGKIGIPLDLLNKSGRLSPEEMTIIKSHTLIGYRILEGSEDPLIQSAARIALYHHENWDGSGYPYGLCRGDIPLEARIVAVADVYDALMSQRAYKPAWEETAVVAELQRLRGIKFDPEILDVFLMHVAEMIA